MSQYIIITYGTKSEENQSDKSFCFQVYFHEVLIWKTFQLRIYQQGTVYPRLTARQEVHSKKVKSANVVQN